MKIVAISDLHGNLIDLPECNVVCICGDIFPLSFQSNTIKSISWFLLDFIPWTNNLKCEKVIFVAGNHDILFEDLYQKYHKLDWEIENLLLTSHLKNTKIKYLCDSLYVYNGIKFYGSPWCPDLKQWAFYGDSIKLQNIFSCIPENIDILITHCPPKIGDCGMVLQPGWNYGKDFGCKELASQYPRIHPKYHIYGHVHSSTHQVTKYLDTNLVNVSLLDEDYELSYFPFEFDI